MPTPYTGVSTDAQAPGGAPEPEGAPLVALPVDTDPPNGSTYHQAYKALADWVAFALRPMAKAVDWAKAITVWRSAAGHRGFGIDHMGFPAGRLNHWRECWNDAANVLYLAGGAVGGVSGVFSDGWYATLHRAGTGGGTARIAFVDPGIGWPASRRCKIETGDDVGSYSRITRFAPAMFAPDVAFAMEWDAVVDDFTPREVRIGFNDPTFGAGPASALFHANGTGVNYFAVTSAGGVETATDTGVPMNTSTRRFRIEYHAASMDDAGTERVLFFIDGVPVADHTTNLPTGAISPPLACPWFEQVNTSGPGGILWLTPITFGSNLWVDAF